ncbi:hypothetical protein GCK72_013473 [Caenorhabditis remanei]|uniref:Uncharacterized protein n=1 Tax=Caenorhabditis remanei TaxID=31234 RepID=A0A6A5GNN9_CAERE|nr:hypothetical protein GCK72_013473 [Caenorhabditis remanei]KAF1757018.1 hypothetical protein GCK72_013473 [Caenorhabditis remanei]
MNLAYLCICILMILLVGIAEPVRDLNSLTNLKEFFREVQRRAREKAGRTQPTREFLGFANDGSSFRNPLSTGGGFRTGRSIIWKTSELPSIRGIDRRFREELVNTEFRTGRAIDPRLYDLPSTRAPNQPAQNNNLRNDNSSEDPLTDGNWFEMLVALSSLPHN